MADNRWKVGETISTISGPSMVIGYGFSIQDFRGAPLLSISYKTQEEAKEAAAAIRMALEAAIDITKG
jgi:hypothetical protein